jgi:hypothetical protein
MRPPPYRRQTRHSRSVAAGADKERERATEVAFDWLDRLPVLALISHEELAVAHRKLVELLLMERFDAARAAVGRLTWKK